MTDYSILVGGQAGQGSGKAAIVVAKLFSRYGYRVFIFDDYQSLIRGGHNFSQIRASDSKEKVLTHKTHIDYLLALDERTIKEHKDYLPENGTVVYNKERISLDEGLKEEAIGVEAKSIVEEAGGKPMMENVALIGAFIKEIGVEWKDLEEIIKEEFDKATETNLKIAEESYNTKQGSLNIEKLENKPLSLLTGNQAAALGMVKAGLNLCISYPMTPAAGVLHYLAEYKSELNIGVTQVENEISVMNAAIGAAYSGARSAVATSGGGFALMTEAFSLAAQSETPIVVIESQRGAPGTGVPTYALQGDLKFVLGAGHGDIVRFVVAPGDAEESFYWGGKTLNLSWKYQTPSILLLDKGISENAYQLDDQILEEVEKEEPVLWEREGEYQRYEDKENGISPLSFPAEKGVICKATGYEHDEAGITIEDKENVEKMQAKRLRKFEQMKEEAEALEGAVKMYGNKDAKKALVSWGLNKGPSKEVAEELGIKMIQVVVMEPFPETQFKKALEGVEELISVESNGLGQLANLISSYGFEVHRRMLKYDARPFLPEEIKKKVNND